MSCSFCGSLSHNIRSCQDPMIYLLNERIKTIHIEMTIHYPSDVEYYFKNMINRRFYLRELRAVYAVNINNSLARTKSEIINALYLYYTNLSNPFPGQSLLENQGLPTQPDPVPDFARDLNIPPEEDDVSWYIDRTASPASILEFHLFEESHRSNYHPTYRQYGNTSFPEYLSDLIVVPTNLLNDFDAVSGNIPFVSQIKKYDICPLLVLDNIEELEEECAICYENIKLIDMVKLNCNHKFCGNCITNSLKTHDKLCSPSCALCRKKMENFTIKNPEIYNLVSEHCNL